MTSVIGFGKTQNAFLKPCTCEDYPCCGHTMEIDIKFGLIDDFDRLSIPEAIEAIADSLAKGKSPRRAIEAVGCGWDADSYQELIEAVNKVAIKCNRQHRIWSEVVEELWDSFYDQDWSDDGLYW